MIIKWLVLKTLITGCPTKIPVIRDDWMTVKINCCYLFTSVAFVFNPFNELPQHFRRKQISTHFNAWGSLPARETPRISS